MTKHFATRALFYYCVVIVEPAINLPHTAVAFVSVVCLSYKEAGDERGFFSNNSCRAVAVLKDAPVLNMHVWLVTF